MNSPDAIETTELCDGNNMYFKFTFGKELFTESEFIEFPVVQETVVS